MTIKITTPIVRCVYPNLAEPKSLDSDINAGKYTLMVLVPKSETEFVAKVKAAVKEAAEEKFKGKTSGLKSPLKDGDEKLDDDGNVVPMYEDHWYFNLSSNKPPICIGPMKDRLDIGEVAKIKGGDFVRVQIGFSSYDNAGNKGVGSYLNAVQFARAGDPLGGSGASLDDFDTIEEEDVFA